MEMVLKLLVRSCSRNIYGQNLQCQRFVTAFEKFPRIEKKKQCLIKMGCEFSQEKSAEMLVRKGLFTE